MHFRIQNQGQAAAQVVLDALSEQIHRPWKDCSDINNAY